MKIQMEITIPKFLFTSEDFKQKKYIRNKSVCLILMIDKNSFYV